MSSQGKTREKVKMSSSHVLLFTRDLLQSEYKNTDFYIKSFGFKNVRVNGIVIDKLDNSRFLLDDTTGVIQVTCLKQNQNIEKGMSVQVLGQLHVENGIKFITAQLCKIINDINSELAFVLQSIELYRAHYVIASLEKELEWSTNTNTNPATLTNSKNEFLFSPTQNKFSTQMQQKEDEEFINLNRENKPPNEELEPQIVSFIQNNQGASFDVLQKEFTNISEDELRLVLNHLESSFCVFKDQNKYHLL